MRQSAALRIERRGESDAIAREFRDLMRLNDQRKRWIVEDTAELKLRSAD